MLLIAISYGSNSEDPFTLYCNIDGPQDVEPNNIDPGNARECLNYICNKMLLFDEDIDEVLVVDSSNGGEVVVIHRYMYPEC